MIFKTALTWSVDNYSPGGTISWGTDDDQWSAGVIRTELDADICVGDQFKTLEVYLNKQGKTEKAFRRFSNIEIVSERLIEFKRYWSGQERDCLGLEFTWREDHD